jgi:alkylated DNA repair dioxygenase AlkB
MSRELHGAELFAANRPQPEGLSYAPQFIDPAYETLLVAAIEGLPLQEAKYKMYTAKRRVMSFGSEYDFDGNALRPAPEMPAFLAPLRALVAQWTGVAEQDFGHVLVAEYRPGTALGWHRDAPSFDIVAGVSLAGSCRMRFRPYPHVTGTRPPSFALELAPRSAYVLRGEIRRKWQHSIPATKMLRYSVTFRTLAGRSAR